MSMSKSQSKSAKKTNDHNYGSGKSGTQGDMGATATETVDQVKDTVSGLGDQVKQQASNQLMSRLETAAGGLDMAVKLLRTAGETVKEQDKTGVADSMTGMADRIEGWSTSLREQDVDKLVEEAKQVAKRQPMLFVSGALALGFLGARFLRSSAAKQEDETDTSSSDTDDAYRSGRSDDFASSMPADSGVASTNPYPSAEENAALGSTFDDPLERDDTLAFDDPISVRDFDDPRRDTPGSGKSTEKR